MHYGDLVSVSTNSIHLPKELLKPISIHSGSRVYGLYYPSSKSAANKREYKKYLIDHDFMFTPIPSHLWPYLGRFNVLIKHKKGSLDIISRFLAKRNINILTSECNRSGHRYMSWTFTVAFEDVWVKGLDLDESGKFTRGTKKLLNEVEESVEREIKKICAGIKRYCSDVLLDEESCHFEDNVEGYSVKSLLYFYRYCLENRNEIDKPFEATIEGSKIVFSDKGKRLMKHRGVIDHLPAYAFAEINTRDINIRIAVIPKKLLTDFRILSVEYMCTDTRSSRGVLQAVTTPLLDHCNIWRLSQYTTDHSTATEEGRIDFVLQHMDDCSGERTEWNTVESRIKVAKLPDGVKFVNVNSYPIRRLPIFISCKLDSEFLTEIRRDCILVGREFGILKNDFIISSRDTGGGITTSVVKDLENCQGMIQFFVSKKVNTQFDWLNSEALAAIAQKTPYVRVIQKKLENRLTVEKDKKSYYWKRNRSQRQQEIRKALQDLIAMIEGD